MFVGHSPLVTSWLHFSFVSAQHQEAGLTEACRTSPPEVNASASIHRDLTLEAMSKLYRHLPEALQHFLIAQPKSDFSRISKVHSCGREAEVHMLR